MASAELSTACVYGLSDPPDDLGQSEERRVTGKWPELVIGGAWRIRPCVPTAPLHGCRERSCCMSPADVTANACDAMAYGVSSDRV